MKKHMLAKRMGAIALCAVLSTGLLSATAAAQGKDVTAYLSPDLSIVVDGSYRTFYNAVGQEVHPILYGGTTYLPIRAIGELMGKNVNWSQSTLTVSLAGDRPNGSVTGTPDSAAKAQTVQAAIRPDITILVDNVRQTFADANGDTVYPLLYSGSVYLPVRSIGELMDKEVNWNNATRTVTLSGGSLVTDADSFEDNNGSNNGNNNGSNNGSNNGNNNQPSTPTGMITAEQAKQKALAHAGLQSSQVSFVRAHLDWENGRQVYDVEFYTKDYREYDYEIDAYTGKVLSFDYDAEHYRPGTGNGNQNSGSYIGEAEAKRIALAQVPGATENNVRRVKLDWDDGRAEYEVKIVVGMLEYEFEINAVNGAILSQDVDSIYD